MSIKILIIDQHSVQCEQLAGHFQRLGCNVQCSESQSAVWNYLQADTPDIVIIDAAAFGGKVFQKVSRMRQAFPWIGILYLGGGERLEDQAKAMYCGADYYVARPVKKAVLTAIVAALNRRMTARLPQDNVQSHVRWHFERGIGKLSGPVCSPIYFTEKENAVFDALLRSPQFPIRKEHLSQLLKIATDLCGEHRINMVMYRLRKKLDFLTGKPFQIKNIYGEGYLLLKNEDIAVVIV